MASARQRPQAGFTLIELMIVVAIVGILAGIALGEWRSYTRRAKMSEVIMAVTNCKSRIAELYVSMVSPPGSPTAWGCDSTASTTRYATAIQTSANGAIRVTIGNLDPGVNGLHMHLVPVHLDGVTAFNPTADLGRGIPRWACGSDAQFVRNALPSDCRADTSPYAAATFE